VGQEPRLFSKVSYRGLSRGPARCTARNNKPRRGRSPFRRCFLRYPLTKGYSLRTEIPSMSSLWPPDLYLNGVSSGEGRSSCPHAECLAWAQRFQIYCIICSTTGISTLAKGPTNGPCPSVVEMISELPVPLNVGGKPTSYIDLLLVTYSSARGYSALVKLKRSSSKLNIRYPS
jgi:hypothetical protein